jgi:serine/threonine-protein kinase HipA
VRELHSFINDRPVGVLSEEGDSWAFAYEPAWASDPEGFDLSPALPRSAGRIVDGASERPVQWYFDNLLPEEGLRTIYAREARLGGEDAFGLLAFYGAESAGSLVLLPPGQGPVAAGGCRPLPDEELSARIRNLPRVPLMRDAPKRMSVAGAQHKLLVVLEGDDLFEPMPGEASTHILKPNHPDDAYRSTVINEYFTMRLARALGLAVPEVSRRYVPEPVYLVERFDRYREGGVVRRRHAIDTCQLLGRARAFKYTAATVESLSAIADACRAPAAARLWLFRWLVFNLIVGNGDNHLKNISALVSAEGIELAPAYDLLSTAVYETRAFNEQPRWPDVELALPLPGARHFGEVTRARVMEAADALGVPSAIAGRELSRFVGKAASEARGLIDRIEFENDSVTETARVHLAGEMRLVRAIETVVIAEAMARLV